MDLIRAYERRLGSGAVLGEASDAAPQCPRDARQHAVFWGQDSFSSGAAAALPYDGFAATWAPAQRSGAGAPIWYAISARETFYRALMRAVGDACPGANFTAQQQHRYIAQLERLNAYLLARFDTGQQSVAQLAAQERIRSGCGAALLRAAQAADQAVVALRRTLRQALLLPQPNWPTLQGAYAHLRFCRAAEAAALPPGPAALGPRPTPAHTVHKAEALPDAGAATANWFTGEIGDVLTTRLFAFLDLRSLGALAQTSRSLRAYILDEGHPLGAAWLRQRAAQAHGVEPVLFAEGGTALLSRLAYLREAHTHLRRGLAQARIVGWHEAGLQGSARAAPIYVADRLQQSARHILRSEVDAGLLSRVDLLGLQPPLDLRLPGFDLREVFQVSLSGDGSRLAFAYRPFDLAPQLWTADLARPAAPPTLLGSMDSFALSRDGQRALCLEAVMAPEPAAADLAAAAPAARWHTSLALHAGGQTGAAAQIQLPSRAHSPVLGRVFAAVLADHQVILLHPTTLQPQPGFDLGFCAHHLSLAADETTLLAYACGRALGRVAVLRLTDRPGLVCVDHPFPITCACLSADQQVLAIASQAAIRFVGLPQGTTLATLDLRHRDLALPLGEMAFSPLGDRLHGLSDSGQVYQIFFTAPPLPGAAPP